MKTFSTSGTGNEQTLSEIESDKMPIYDSLTDVEADLANLSVGQIVATKDTGTELSAPVDTVQSGNMHAVTSNAVAEAVAKCSPNYAQKELIYNGTTNYSNNYTVPSNGYLIGRGNGHSPATSFIYFEVNGVKIGNQGYSTETIGALLPVRKGNIVSIVVYLADTNEGIFFVPCN